MVFDHDYSEGYVLFAHQRGGEGRHLLCLKAMPNAGLDASHLPCKKGAVITLSAR